MLLALLVMLIFDLPMSSMAESSPARFTGSEAVRLGKESQNIYAIIMQKDGSLSTSIARHWVTVDGVKHTAFCIEAAKSSTSGRDGGLERSSDVGLLWILTHVSDDTNEEYAIKQQAIWAYLGQSFPIRDLAAGEHCSLSTEELRQQLTDIVQQAQNASASVSQELWIAYHLDSRNEYQDMAFAVDALPTATPEPTEVPTPEPTATPEPTEVPTPEPNATPEPTEAPTPEPTATPEPTEVPTPEPTATPEPTEAPTPEPTVNKELWNETFGAETPFPTTYQELFAMMLEWERDFADSYPNVNMTDDWNMSTLLSRMIEQYIIACEETGQQLSFDTPIFTETAAAFAELVSTMNQERFERNANQDGVTMFSTCNLSQLLQMNGDMLVLQPFQMDADDPAVRVDVVVLVGNSATQYPDETQELITHLSQPEYLSYETQYALFVSCNQPLTYTQGKTERSITLEGIEAYQSLLPLMKLSANSCYLGQSDSESSFTSSIQTYMQQFVTGKMNAQQFVMRLDDVAAMLWLESLE